MQFFLLSILLGLLIFSGFLFWGRGYLAWVAGGALMLGGWYLFGSPPPLLFWLLTVIFILLAILFGIRPLRRQVVTRFLMAPFGAMLPHMGETERTALEAGTVWWDAELFSGKPRWKNLLETRFQGLHENEKEFLSGPVEDLCRRLDDWQVIQDRDLPEWAWEFLKKHRFFGMIIPKEYGGLEFSANAHAQVITKLASRSITAAVTVMVPNSLGPAELLLAYGTGPQKKYYLPRLARGEEIPCFALTGPEAGSDAAATQSTGIVCRGTFEGKEVLGMKLNWNKRYITLGPVSTVIGLAFHLRDPDHLLGEKEDVGITCALIPSHLEGIEIGFRHDPLSVPFQNGPNQGKDVFVPLDFIIGGAEMAGQGWRMLMESLGAGRGISLPSLSVAGTQLASRVVGAYATVREQFDTPIGRFEGIEEPLAKIGALTYLTTASWGMTLGAIDAGEKPAVITAIVKAYLTEILRLVANEAMDIRAGAGIMQGPRNILGRLYKALPIAITVEGANILTRSMIIYGQGAIRCHPFIQKEMQAVADKNLKKLDAALFGHLNLIFRNITRTLLLSLTGARLSHVPVKGPLAPYLRRLNRLSAAYASVSEMTMATLGGALKRREKITGRLADGLAWMYLGSATLKHFYDSGQPGRDLCFARWALDHCLFQIQTALKGILNNFPNRFLAALLNVLIFPWGTHLTPPRDNLGSEVARGLLEDRMQRLDLTPHIYIPDPKEPGLGHLEAALDKAVPALKVETQVRDAVRAGRLDKAPGEQLLKEALKENIISREEFEAVQEANEIQREVIQVDAFDPKIFKNLKS
jgi:acyl-CoA dehydrogenase